MKKPDEIKKGLKICYMGLGCEKCPYVTVPAPFCYDDMKRDALAYIQQLEETISNLGHLNETMYSEAKKGIQELESRLAQVERGRDAAVRIVHGLCLHCKNEDSKDETCRECMYYPYRVVYGTGDTCVDNWQWRGVCAENTKEG